MDKLDQLLTLYAERSIEEEARCFLSLDVSDIEYNEQIKQRLLSYAFKRKGHTRMRQTVKVVLVACLIAVALTLTACMSISEIRDAIWRAVIGWYDDYISVEFEETTSNTDGTHNPEANINKNSSEDIIDPQINVPEIIEQKVYATYLPEGYYIGNESSNLGFLIIDFYDSSNTWKFSLSQSAQANSDWMLDNGDINFTKINLGKCEAVLTEHIEKTNYYSITWQDSLYTYNLFGTFPSLYEAIQIAKGICWQ